MTTVEDIHKLAEAILGQGDGEHDLTNIFEALEPFMDKEDYVTLAEGMELCPVHHCDLQICIDDGVHGDEVYKVYGWLRKS